jgi:hypothetical protein
MVHRDGEAKFIGPTTGASIAIVPLSNIGPVDPDLGPVIAGDADAGSHGPAIAGAKGRGVKKKEQREKLLHP